MSEAAVPKEGALRKDGVLSYIKGLFSQKGSQVTRANTAPSAAPPQPRGYTPAQQRELEYLCAELFKRKSFVTSGKLQLIGLEKVKSAMGARWPAMQSLVYMVADQVITRHMTKSDIFVRLKDDAYVIIFGNESYDTGNEKAGRIADEIRKRLFDSGYKELREIGVHKHVVETKAADLASLSPSDALAIMTFRPTRPGIPSDATTLAAKQEATIPEGPMSLAAAQTKALAALTVPVPTELLRVSYTPVWDHQKNAITSYACYPAAGTSCPPGADRDLGLLRSVAAELELMAADGRKLLIVCPVRQDTLYNQRNFDRYAGVTRLIPEEQRKMLVFLLTDVAEDLQKKNGYWFVAELKKLCKGIFLETSLASPTDFTNLRRTGFDAVGASLEPGQEERVLLGRLREFRNRAEVASIAKTFILNVSSLSMTTSTVCMGFDCLGGPAIHETVKAPDSIYRFLNEDLFTENTKQGIN